MNRKIENFVAIPPLLISGSNKLFFFSKNTLSFKREIETELLGIKEEQGCSIITRE